MTPLLNPLPRMASAALGCLLAYALPLSAGTWTANNAPGNLNLPLLMADGSILIQKGPGYSNFFRLYPDNQGHYLNANNWTTNVAAMPENRQMFASDVLPDGRVFVAGGEYGTQPGGGHRAAVFDPVNNFWTPVAVPANWLQTNLTVTTITGSTVNGGFADAPSIVLSDGSVMVVPIYPATNNVAFIYHPAANTWSTTPPALAYYSLNESALNKLPDGSILALDKGATTTERYVPSLGQWIADYPAPVNLFSGLSEIGASLLLPDGRVFFFGGTGATLYYTPSGSTNVGAWTQGPNLPNGLVARDTPAALLPNGNIFCALTPGTNTSDKPIFFYEYNPTTYVFTPQLAPNGYNSYSNNITDQTEMLVLPDGNVLFTDSSAAKAYIYQPSSNSPQSSWKPVITGYWFNGDGSLHVTGRQLNGLSQGATFGDDNQNDSNYPLVRFFDGSGNLQYGRTFNWSSTGVQTGGALVSTECVVPASVLAGPGVYTIQVVANGIASDPVGFPGPIWVDFTYNLNPKLGTISNPFNTMVQATNAVAVGATILIKPGSSPETMIISKPMIITSVGGTALIGR